MCLTTTNGLFLHFGLRRQQAHRCSAEGI